jgi:hypothetical protein
VANPQLLLQQVKTAGQVAPPGGQTILEPASAFSHVQPGPIAVPAQ